MVLGLVFLGMFFIAGLEGRESHQVIFTLSLICGFSLLLDNLWIVLFTFWTIFLYTFYKFNVGDIYVANLFYGSVLYFITKLVFQKKHIDLFVTVLLWYCVVNLGYSIMQVLDWDLYFIYPNGKYNILPFGFMANVGITGMLYCLAIPLLATRTKWWYGLLLFVPLFFARSSVNIIAACAGLAFVIFFRVKRWVFASAVILLVLFSVFYCFKIDAHIGTERFGIWKMSLRDAILHPIVGWGLDSYKNLTPQKGFAYADKVEVVEDKVKVSSWDNPHNLVISLFYEWGIFGLIIVGCYLLSLARRFKCAIKTPNSIGLAGAVLAFLVISMAHFPLFIGRVAVIVVPIFCLLECENN